MNLKNLIIVIMSLSMIGCIGGSGTSSSVTSSSSVADYALAKSTSFSEGSLFFNSLILPFIKSKNK